VEARAIEAARLGCDVWVVVVVVVSWWEDVVVGVIVGFRFVLCLEVVVFDELDLVGDGCRLCGLLLVVVFVLLLPGAALRLRPLRYSSAGLRKIPVLFWTISEEVPSSDDVMPVTGSQRWFSTRIGFVR
jgi:hypothetical protein